MRVFRLVTIFLLFVFLSSGVLGLVGEAGAEPLAPKLLPAVVASVSDGDTVHAKFNSRDERVRMIGVNCPEISHPDLHIKEQPYGRQAAAYTKKRLFGKKVWLEFDVQQRDKYGRLLVRLAFPAGTVHGERGPGQDVQRPAPAGRLRPSDDGAAEREVR